MGKSPRIPAMMKQYDREGTPEELWAFKNWIMGAADREAMKERWKREEEKQQEAIRRLREMEFQQELERMRKRNLLRDLLGI
jgi:hypothetical protein